MRHARHKENKSNNPLVAIAQDPNQEGKLFKTKQVFSVYIARASIFN